MELREAVRDPEVIAAKQIRDQTIVTRVAATVTELEQAYRLAYECYVQRGYMAPNPYGMRVSHFNLLPGTATLVAKSAHKVVGTVTCVTRDERFGLPCEALYSCEDWIRKRYKVVEAVSLAVNEEARDQTADVLLPLCRLGIEYSRVCLQADILIAVIHPRLKRFFDSVLHFESIDDQVRSRASYVNGAPAIARYIHLQHYPAKLAAVHERGHDRKNMLEVFYGKQQSDAPNGTQINLDWPAIESLFVRKSNLVSGLKVDDLAYIAKLYSDPMCRKRLIDCHGTMRRL